MSPIVLLYSEYFGKSPYKIESLPKAGSNRNYFRLFAEDGSSVIGVCSPSTDENHCFVYLTRHFYDKGLPVPKVLAVSKDKLCYLQQDLGHTSLYDLLKEGRTSGVYNQEETRLISKTIRLLPHIQVKGGEGLDYTQCLNPIVFNEEAAMFDLNYFKYCFLRTTDVSFDEVLLQKDFNSFAADLVKYGKGNTFLYRDFQSRNVMIKNDAPYFIDYQGGLQGPLQYDLASFLWQASAHYPPTLREEMISEYLDELSHIQTFNEQEFRQGLKLFVLFRTLQVLGAYGLRGKFERKQYFIDSIPAALQNLHGLLKEGICKPYPYLENILYQITTSTSQHSPRPTVGVASTSIHDGKGPLVVRVFSFSYKKGIPEDTSGNGGGYVFDCRSTHNPGRYEPYKKLTGLDAPVIQFLEDDGEILTFLQSAIHLADAHIARYIQRGFTDLMFSFGCTGGQHRSVYCAQHLAEHIHQKFGIEVHLCHREQGISSTLPTHTNK